MNLSAKFVSWTLLALTLVSGGLAQADPGAAEVFDRSLKALGGKDQLRSIQSVRLTGQGMAFRISSTFTIEARFPGQLRLEANTVPYQFVHAFDGTTAWERQAWEGMDPPSSPPYFREVGGVVLERTRRNAGFMPYQAVLDLKPVLEGKKDWQERSVYVLTFTPAGGTAESYYVDTETYLPLARRYASQYVNGGHEVVTEYGDYAPVQGGSGGKVLLPRRLHFPGPDLPGVQFFINDIVYELNPRLDADRFAYPLEGHRKEPYAATLDTVPFGVYKEADWLGGIDNWDQNPRWGVIFAPTETWTFDLLVREQFGRWLEPKHATVDFYAGNAKIKSTEFSGAALAVTQRSNVSRYSGMSSNQVFRHHFTEPADLQIDRMAYRMVLADASGNEVIAQRNIPVERYQQKTQLIFPIKGPFIVLSGHTYDDINHKDEWTQWGAYDIYPLSPKQHAIHTDSDTVNENFYGYRRAEVLAPADGVVTYARNDISDITGPDLLFSGIDDPVQAIGGNIVLIDHGNNEASFFGHLSHGSVKVKVGDRVKQGEVIALLGATNATSVPHLHYQLQAIPIFPRGDGLPSHFENLETVAPIPGYPVSTALRGFYLNAK